MSLKAGELFVEIGIKGGEKAVGVLRDVKNWLTDTKTEALAGKAALLGTLYGLERLTHASGEFGNNLTNLSLLTGVNTTKIQQWGEYMRRSGGQAEDAYASLQKVQSAQTQHILGNKATDLAIGRVALTTGKNLLQYANDPLKWLEIVKEYLVNTKDAIGVANAAALELVAPGFITSVRKNPKLDPYKLNENISGEGEVAKLARVHQAWSDFEASLTRIRNLLTSKWGLPIIEELTAGIKVLKEFALWLDKIFTTKEPKTLGEKVTAFERREPGIGAEKKNPEMDESLGALVKKTARDDNANGDIPPQSKSVMDYLKHFIEQPKQEVYDKTKMDIPLFKAYPPPKNPTINVNVHQTGIPNSHGGVHEVQKHVKKAMQQSHNETQAAIPTNRQAN